MFEVVFRKGMSEDDEQIARNVSPFTVEPGQVHLPAGARRVGVHRVRPDLRPLPHRQGPVASRAVHSSAPCGLTGDKVGFVPTTLTNEQQAAAISLIRGFAMDAPLKAKSGHQGTAMALAPLAHVLFSRVMRHDPANPHWPDRDRFILSNGHASILQYSMLYLAGYGLELDDIKAFRQWGSLTPGHPEAEPHHRHRGHHRAARPGLRQRRRHGDRRAPAAHAVRRRRDQPPHVRDRRRRLLQEGVSHEAASLAGHQRLGNLICVYDDNHITIDGNTSLAYSDDVGMRFEAYGWNVVHLGEMADDCDGARGGARRPPRPSPTSRRC